MEYHDKDEKFYNKCEEDIMQSICGVENSFSGQFPLRQNTEDQAIIASFLKLRDVQNFFKSNMKANMQKSAISKYINTVLKPCILDIMF